MLKDKSSSAILAVDDIDRAKKFYRDTLGLPLEDESTGDVLTFRTGDTRLIVYRSDFAGTNKANAVVWGVGDEIDAIVADLRKKGVAFEHYLDQPGTQLEGDMHVAGPMKMAWLKDPAGNLLHLNNM